MDRRRQQPRGEGPVMREEDISIAPDYGRIYGEGLRNAANPYRPGDLAPTTLEMQRERENNAFGDAVRRYRAFPQRMKNGGVVRGDGCAIRGKTKGKFV